MADRYLPLVLAAASLASAVLVGVAILALVRRQSLSYGLVAAAIGTLLIRSILGIGTHVGVFAGHTHHFLEHILDVAVVTLLIAAIALARRSPSEPPSDRRYRRLDDDYENEYR